MKIGIIKEGKIPLDRRVPLTPAQCREVFERYPHIKIVVQPFGNRCFMDEEYEEMCVQLQVDLFDCDLLMGIKEVPVEELHPFKTYLFFSHTTKKQEHNKALLKAVLEKNIRLIDYELLTDSKGNRLVGFGKWAGLVGAYNAFRAYALRNEMVEPRPAHLCGSLNKVKKNARALDIKPIKIVVTGGGRVAKGAIELLDDMGIKKVGEQEYLEVDTFDQPVYTQIEPDAYVKHKEGKEFNFNHFAEYPELYENNFLRFSEKTDMLISAAFWAPKAPVLFTKEDMKKESFRIRIIADISCDINGAIPSTLRASTIVDPFYGYNPQTEQECLAFTSPDHISVTAVDNLPCELPKDASKEFGRIIINKVIPHISNGDKEGVLERATIAKGGKLTDAYAYLESWLSQ